MINFKTNNLTFGKSNIKAIKENYIQINTNDGPFILFVPRGNDLSFRSSFIKNSNYNMYIMITKETLEDLKDLLGKGNTVDCFIPMKYPQPV